MEVHNVVLWVSRATPHPKLGSLMFSTHLTAVTTDVRTNVWIEEEFHPHLFGPLSGRNLPHARVRDFKITLGGGAYLDAKI